MASIATTWTPTWFRLNSVSTPTPFCVVTVPVLPAAADPLPARCQHSDDSKGAPGRARLW
ncbi:hypothetical protein AoKodu_06580 [Actinomyces oris K20]|nr:hypothetical protein AoKodu_06580 [Actinomyces oris K20]